MLITTEMAQCFKVESLKDCPITILRLIETLKSTLFSKVQLLHDVVKNGIMDFLVGSENDIEHGKMLFGPEFYQ